MSVAVETLATRARRELVDELAAGGVEASTDSGAFYPQPIGVLVGLPTLVGFTLGLSRSFTIPVLVVSGDPLNSDERVDAIYALADDVAGILSTPAYRPASYRSTANAEPLPAIELVVTVTVSPEEV